MSLGSNDASDLFRRAPADHIPVDGSTAGEVAYRVVGSGPDVLFVHGWPVTGATFRRLLPHLADHVTCHVVDLPGAGDSRYDRSTPLSIDHHVRAVRSVVDHLGLRDVALVGHDSGGMIARHAMAGDARLRALGLIDSEQTHGVSLRFRLFLAGRHLPGFGSALSWAAGNRRVRRNGLVLGGAFVDRDLLDGEFDEFFLRRLQEPAYRQATMQLLRSFRYELIQDLPSLHRRIEVPVSLVWGSADPFFPVARARQMVGTFPDAVLHEIDGAALFSHEERPAEVAAALLPVLTG